MMKRSKRTGSTLRRAACLLLASVLMTGCGKKTSAAYDVDLAVMSSTMVYAEVFNMMTEPEKYLGKTVRMEGQFMRYVNEETGETWYACFIQDATACCAQGIEFVPKEEYRYPDAFPEEGETIAVTGVFDTYEEAGNTYCTLRNADLYA